MDQGQPTDFSDAITLVIAHLRQTADQHLDDTLNISRAPDDRAKSWGYYHEYVGLIIEIIETLVIVKG